MATNLVVRPRRGESIERVIKRFNKKVKKTFNKKILQILHLNSTPPLNAKRRTLTVTK